MPCVLHWPPLVPSYFAPCLSLLGWARLPRRQEFHRSQLRPLWQFWAQTNGLMAGILMQCNFMFRGTTALLTLTGVETIIPEFMLAQLSYFSFSACHYMSGPSRCGLACSSMLLFLQKCHGTVLCKNLVPMVRQRYPTGIHRHLLAPKSKHTTTTKTKLQLKHRYYNDHHH